MSGELEKKTNKIETEIELNKLIWLGIFFLHFFNKKKIGDKRESQTILTTVKKAFFEEIIEIDSEKGNQICKKGKKILLQFQSKRQTK